MRNAGSASARPRGAAARLPAISLSARHAAEYAAFILAAALTGRLPLPIARTAGEILGGIVYRVGGERRRTAERNMQRVLGLPAGPAAQRAGREVFRSYGRYWAEALWLRPDRLQALLPMANVSGAEHMEAAKRAGTGVIFALPHLGNFEVPADVVKRAGFSLMGVAEALPNRRLTDWFVRMRSSLGAEMVLTEGDSMLRLARHLSRGDAVAVLADRDITGRGTKVSFFGQEARMPRGPVILAMRTGAALLPSVSWFDDGAYRLSIGAPLLLPEDGSREERVRQGTQLLVRHLEEAIRAHATQWLVLQPVWEESR